MAIDSIKSLKEKLVLDDEAERDLPKLFDELADALLYDFVIRKGEKVYHIHTIEFYWYSDDHRDIITYPRNCEAGMWFFHASGVDLTFRSHVDTEEILIPRKGKTQRKVNKPLFNGTNTRFGGILIKCISDEAGNCYDGPQIVVNELFDKFDALGAGALPVLEYCPSEHKTRVLAKRKGLTPTNWDDMTVIQKDVWVKEKIGKISANYSNSDAVKADVDLVEQYKRFAEEPYSYSMGK